MKRALVLFFVVLMLSPPAFAYNGGERVSIDDINDLPIGKIPRTWRTWPFHRDKAEKIYVVKEEKGNRFIRARDEWNISTQLFRNFYWKVEEHPLLSWRWRARILPAGSREDKDDLNDSACGVYVIIGKTSGHALKYVWSTTLPVDTIVTRKEGRLKIKVVDSGTTHVGQWQTHTVDVLKDYKELFGKDLTRDPSGIAILTDGNAVHLPAECDYDDFVVSTRSSP